MSRTSDRKYQAKRARLKAEGPHVCHICGQPIDPALTWPDPKSWSYDHEEPVALGGHNLGPGQPAHLDCNRRRRTQTVGQVRPVRHSRQHY